MVVAPELPLIIPGPGTDGSVAAALPPIIVGYDGELQPAASNRAATAAGTTTQRRHAQGRPWIQCISAAADPSGPKVPGSGNRLVHPDTGHQQSADWPVNGVDWRAADADIPAEVPRSRPCPASSSARFRRYAAGVCRMSSRVGDEGKPTDCSPVRNRGC